MFGNSRGVISNQSAPLPSLKRLVQKHAATHWSRPPAEFSLELWERLRRWRTPGRPLLLDLGCGRGDASLDLHRVRPDAQVLGLDRSAARLQGRSAESPSLFLARGELEDMVPLMAEGGWRAELVYVLYPNPWPKPTQATKRWPYHAIWPFFLRLGPLELRTNWKVYADEWAMAVSEAGLEVTQALAFTQPLEPVSAFEKKYLGSGQVLYRVTSRSAPSRAESR